MDSHQTLDACESRWLIRIMRIKYKDRITNETIRPEDTGTSVQQDQIDAIKMAFACVTDEGQQTDQKCTSLVSNWEKIKRTTEQKMAGLY